jgi:imidazolonepropionase-like amidohydrolase
MKLRALVDEVNLQISSTLSSQEMLESGRMTMTTFKGTRRWLLFAALPLFLYPGTVALHAQTRPQVLEVSTLYDGRGNVLHNTRVVVQDGKIVRIDPKATGDMIDLRGLTVMPGWIDVHVHITTHFGTNGKMGEPTCGSERYLEAVGKAKDASGATPETPALECETPADAELAIMHNAWATLEAGFTTVQSVGAPDDKDLRDAINRGDIPGPRILTALRPITNPSLTLDQIREWVRQVKMDGGDLIKIFVSKPMREGGGRTLNDEQLAAACNEAKAEGLRSLVHAYRDGSRAATLAGCTEVEHGILASSDDLKLMAENGTYFDPQAGLVLHNYMDNWEHFKGTGGMNDAAYASLERLMPLDTAVFRQAMATPGLKVVFGTDAVAGAHGRNAEEFIYRVKEGGQNPMAAMVAAQSLAAASLNMQDQIGTIAPGLQADIIGIAGDPLKDITVVRHVAFVMKGGTIYKLTPRD